MSIHRNPWPALDSSWDKDELREAVEAAAETMNMTTGEFVVAALRGSSSAVLLTPVKNNESSEAVRHESHWQHLNNNEIVLDDDTTYAIENTKKNRAEIMDLIRTGSIVSMKEARSRIRRMPPRAIWDMTPWSISG